MPNLRGPELLLIVLLIVLLFGAKRLPDAARSIGRSLRIFKAETKGLVEGEVATEPPPAVSGPTSSAQAVPQPEAVRQPEAEPIRTQAQPPSQV